MSLGVAPLCAQSYESAEPDFPSPSRCTLGLHFLSLSYFRNYGQLRLEVSPAPVILTGENGSGKTNILEALSLLAPGRGLRKARLGDISTVGTQGAWAVAAGVDGIQGNVLIGTGVDLQNEERRLVRIDGKNVRGHHDLASHLSIIWLTPQLEQLFQEGTGAERKFMDRLVYGFEPGHAARVNEYEYAMRERNRLLAEGTSDPYWLEALEHTMAETGAAIATSRLSALANINQAMSGLRSSFPHAHLSVSGWLEERLISGEPAIQVEKIYKETLAQSRREDMRAGRALAGVHRSLFLALHKEKNMPAGQCSTGEQKALMLAILLSQVRASIDWKNMVPILLLDEIVAHLDATRRLELFEEICQTGAQVWMTGTDAERFAEMHSRAQHFRVSEGKVLPL